MIGGGGIAGERRSGAVIDWGHCMLSVWPECNSTLRRSPNRNRCDVLAAFASFNVFERRFDRQSENVFSVGVEDQSQRLGNLEAPHIIHGLQQFRLCAHFAKDENAIPL